MRLRTLSQWTTYGWLPLRIGRVARPREPGPHACACPACPEFVEGSPPSSGGRRISPFEACLHASVLRVGSFVLRFFHVGLLISWVGLWFCHSQLFIARPSLVRCTGGALATSGLPCLP